MMVCIVFMHIQQTLVYNARGKNGNKYIHICIILCIDYGDNSSDV